MHSRSAGKNSAKTNGSGNPGYLSREDEALSRSLVEARLDARILKDFPGQVPTSLEQAYGVQAAVMAHLPDEVVGWKVARLPPADLQRLVQERLAGPVYRSTVDTVELGMASSAKIFDGGFAAIEAEIVLELGQDIPPKFDVSEIEDLTSLVAKAYCGAEIASSPMPFVIDLGAMSIISDMGINAGVIVGPEIAGFAELPKDALAVSTSIDGSVVGEARPGPITGTPFDALRFLIGHCVASDIELAKGTLVSTGMITGVHEVSVDSRARVDFGVAGCFDVTFNAIKPVNGS